MKQQPIRLIVTLQPEEIKAIKTEADIDKLFKEKTEVSLYNLKVDIKKFLKLEPEKTNEPEIVKGSSETSGEGSAK